MRTYPIGKSLLTVRPNELRIVSGPGPERAAESASLKSTKAFLLKQADQ